MTKKIDWSDLRQRRGILKLADDIFMLLAVVLNLMFITFDWHFNFRFFQNFLNNISPAFFEFYRDEIHPNFLLYDLIFVVIFVSELLISWGFAIKNKIYSRWWFYPLIHWYDVLGCIPLGVFRWLRIFRVLSMLLRLHKMGVIDLRENILYKNAYSLYKAFTDRITDKVLINLVSGIQREVTKESSPESKGSPLAEAVRPDQEQLAKLLSERIQRTAKNNYESYKDEIKLRIDTVVKDGFEQSEEMKKIEQIPLVGKQITQTLSVSLSDITYQLIDSMFKQVTAEDTGKLIEDSIHTTLDSALTEDQKEAIQEDKRDEELNRIIRNILGRVLERIKNDIGKKESEEDGFDELDLGDENK
ncbi:MAG: hypothetical protein WD048_12465 [Chitinophagales bacterium]